MQKLDRLVWASGLIVEAYGLRIGIRCNKPEVPAEVATALPPGAVPAAGPFVDLLCSLVVGGASERPGVRNYHVLYYGFERIARTMEFAEVLEALENSLQLFLGEFARKHVFLHAGVVGWKGRALVLPGRSHAGKSSLVAELVKAGAEYYSDEYAVVDREGNIHPYPRRLALRRPDGRLPHRLRPEDLGGQCGTRPLRDGMVVLSRYRPGRDELTWSPRRLGVSQACLKLIDHAVAARSQPVSVLDTVSGLARRLPVYQAERGEAAALVPRLLRELESVATQDVVTG
jgi:hypothetical protein